MRTRPRIVLLMVSSIASLAMGPQDWPMWGGNAQRNMANTVEKGIPDSWDVTTGENVKWISQLGSQSYGNPVVAGGKVFVGTNNQAERQPKAKGDKGVVMCFRESDGKFLWQLTHDKLAAGRVNDWPKQGICSSPCVEGNRLYYVSNRCELVCADVEGFLDGENDGPFTGETLSDAIDGDIIWKLDMIEELGVFPHNLASSSPAVDGDLVFVVTSNGVDESHIAIPAPDAPSFIAVNKNTGETVWQHDEPINKEGTSEAKFSNADYPRKNKIDLAIVVEAHRLLPVKDHVARVPVEVLVPQLHLAGGGQNRLRALPGPGPIGSSGFIRNGHDHRFGLFGRQ